MKKLYIGSNGIKIEQIERFDSRIDQFWNKIKESYKAMIVRDQTYLNWRYVEKPGDHYSIFIARKGQDICGYAVLKIVKEENKVIGYIVDFLVLPEESLEDIFLQTILKFMHDQRADFALGRFNEGDRIYQILIRHGFKQRNEFPPIPAVYKFSPYGMEYYDETLIKDVSKWYFCFGDADLV